MPLARLIGDPNKRVRSSVSYTFQELGYAVRDAVPALVKLLDHDEADVRARAATALGHIGPFAESARSRLEALAEDPQEDARVRKRARGALPGLELRAAVTRHRERGGVLLPLLVVRLDSEEPAVRRDVLSFIGYLGSAAVESAPRIVELCDDPDPEMAIIAKQLLGALWHAAHGFDRRAQESVLLGSQPAEAEAEEHPAAPLASRLIRAATVKRTAEVEHGRAG